MAIKNVWEEDDCELLSLLWIRCLKRIYQVVVKVLRGGSSSNPYRLPQNEPSRIRNISGGQPLATGKCLDILYGDLDNDTGKTVKVRQAICIKSYQ
jgi:hypothetical protein